MSSSKSPIPALTVGHDQADVQGTTGRAIQTAVDALSARGGGTVTVLPGEYTCVDSIRLCPNTTLRGTRGETVLKRGPLAWSPVAVDADKAQTEITPVDAGPFRPGMGVILHDERSGWLDAALPHTITRIDDGLLHLSGHLTSDRLAEENGFVLNHFPILLCVEADHVTIEGFTIEAGLEAPAAVLQDLRASAVYIRLSEHVTLRDLDVRHNAGDGICVAYASRYATIEDCCTAHNGYYGIHPGSHAAYCTLRNCDIHDNASDGLYICWGIKHSEFTGNRIWNNGVRDLRSGISIGHKDTDNLIADNHIYENRKYGICFRRKTETNAAHRVTLRNNVIENNGSAPDELTEVKSRLQPSEAIGAGVHVSGMTTDLRLDGNTIRETREGDARHQRHALVLGKGVSSVHMTGNTIDGHPDAAIIDESGGANVLE